jgi:hypothetical protein
VRRNHFYDRSNDPIVPDKIHKSMRGMFAAYLQLIYDLKAGGSMVSTATEHSMHLQE